MWKIHTNQLYKLATQQKHLLCQAQRFIGFFTLTLQFKVLWLILKRGKYSVCSYGMIINVRSGAAAKTYMGKTLLTNSRCQIHTFRTLEVEEVN